MTEILLIQPPIRDFYLTVKRTIPYGLACIAGVLLEKGFSVKIIDGLATGKSRKIEFPEEMKYLKEFYPFPDSSPFALFANFKHFGYSFEHIGKIVREEKPFLVGISSLFTPYIDTALQTAKTIKKFLPSCKIVMGGHHPTGMPEHVLKNPDIDFILRGEGEVSMPVLAEVLKNSMHAQRSSFEKTDTDFFESIPGIGFRKENNKFHINKPVIMENPDDYPLPAIHLIRNEYYQRKKKGFAVIVSSRGCPMKCSYCCVKNSDTSRYRRRSLSSVLSEIDRAVNGYNARFIDFEDENISGNRIWFLSLLKSIEEKYKNYGLELRAMNGLYPPTFDDEVVIAMKQAGFRTLNLSLGSASKTQLKKFNRPDVTWAFDNALNLAEKYGLNSVGYIIAGAPFQKPEDSINDLIFFAKRNVLSGLSVYYPAPGSDDFKLCEKYRLLPEKYSLMRSSSFPLSHTTSRTEGVTLLRLTRILNYMKSLVDQKISIPDPKPCTVTFFKKTDSRIETGRKLLSWFLADGKIRGIDPDGKIIQHMTSIPLSLDFIRKLDMDVLKGS